jgi:hypothetical protein
MLLRWSLLGCRGHAVEKAVTATWRPDADAGLRRYRRAPARNMGGFRP